MKRDHMKTPNEKRPSFLSGVFLLSLSAILVKVTGLVTKIPLLHLLGAQGMGYYNAAYEVYATLFVLSTAGLPVALSILISRRPESGGQIFRSAARLFAAVGAVGSLCLWFFADGIAARIGNAGAGASVRALAPAVLFVCLASAVRGYYQGMGDMSPTAVSQILEAVGKLVFGLALATAACHRGLPLTDVAAAGAWGLSAGTMLALFYLICRIGVDFAREKRNADRGASEHHTSKRPAQRILRPLVAIAVPITLSAGVTPLTRLLDMVLILRRLQGCGYTEEMTGSLYGIYSTLAIPLYSLLPMLIGSLALPIVPGIARARETGDLSAEREIVSTSLRLTCLLGLPASLGLAAFSYPILNLLFGSGNTDMAVAQAAPLLRMLGISVLGGCLVTVLGAMLQAYGRPRVPLYAMLAGSAVKLSAAFILLGIPRVGMLGAPISTFLCHFTVILIESSVLCRLIPHGVSLHGFCLRTGGAAFCAVMGTTLLWQAVDRHLPLPPSAILAAVAFCILIYLILTLRTGALRREDVVSLSHGECLWKLFERLKWTPSGEKVVNFTENKSKFFKTS